MNKGTKIIIYGRQYTGETRSANIQEFAFETEVGKLERLSGIRMMEIPPLKEGESLEEHMMAIEDEKERFFSDLDAYIAKVFGIMENERIRVKSYTIY